MAILKDLIVSGVSRFIGDIFGSKFIVNGGTSSLFLKADGSLDGTTYCSNSDSRLSNARTPTSHIHGNITNEGKIGSTASLPLITTTGGTVTTGTFGTAAGTFCQGNDSRLSNSRPASDVYSWAKASTKPSYNLDEISDGTNKKWGNKIGKTIEITWANLKAARDNSQLVPGQWYRIIDYECTTTQKDTRSAGNVFDIIVRADANNALNENAYAAKHSGDTYFTNAGAKLEAWELKYSLDNKYWSLQKKTIATVQGNGWGSSSVTLVSVSDGTYTWSGSFPWGSTVYSSSASNGASVTYSGSTYGTLQNVTTTTDEGTGTITYMKDEKGNECSYDFKNIQFKFSTSYGNILNTLYYYTFSLIEGSVQSYIYDFSLYDNCCMNKIPATKDRTLNSNVFGVPSSTLEVIYNIFGANCYKNRSTGNFYDNAFGNDCYGNTFGSNCNNNAFGNDCYGNTFGSNCNNNAFGNSCYGNTFGSNCNNNAFGNSCYYIKFGTSSDVKNYIQNIIIENGNQYIYLNCSATTSSSSPMRNVKIAQGVNNRSSYKTITHTTAGDTFRTLYKPANSTEVTV